MCIVSYVESQIVSEKKIEGAILFKVQKCGEKSPWQEKL